MINETEFLAELKYLIGKTILLEAKEKQIINNSEYQKALDYLFDYYLPKISSLIVKEITEDGDK